MQGELKQQLASLESSMKEFSFLVSDTDGELDIVVSDGKAVAISPSSLKGSSNHNSNIMSINEKIARDGTRFITSDFIFHYSSVRMAGQSIGSLAIASGAGAVLRFIRNNWPDFTALNGSRTKFIHLKF